MRYPNRVPRSRSASTGSARLADVSEELGQVRGAAAAVDGVLISLSADSASRAPAQAARVEPGGPGLIKARGVSGLGEAVGDRLEEPGHVNRFG